MFYLMQFCTLPRVKNLPIFLGAGDFPSKNVGAERSDGGQISEKFDFFGFLHVFFAKKCSRGTKMLNHYSWRSSTIFRHIFEEHKLQNINLSNNLLIAERTGWAGNEKMDEAQLERSAPLKFHSTAPWILNPDWPFWNRDWTYHW